jgi:hypothetical protein
MIKFWRWPPKSTADKVYFGFVFFAIIASAFHFSSNYINKEGFLNMEKKYRTLKRKVSKNLEGMIDVLPGKINLRHKVKKIKRKFIS